MQFLNIIGWIFLLVSAVNCFLANNRYPEEDCVVKHGLADCSNKRLSYLPLSLPPTIVQLDASNNELRLLQWPLPYFHLVSLNLSRNNIQYVNFQSVIHLFSLDLLDFTNNNIKYLSQLDSNMTFYHTQQLTQLILKKNPIKSLGRDPIRCDSLKFLDLSECDIGELEGETSLLLMPTLKKLVLNKNPLMKIDILVSESLEELYLRETILKYIRPELYMGLPRLKILDLSRNYQLASLSRIGIPTSQSLKVLRAEFCSIEYIKLKGLPRLEELYLRSNRIDRISHGDFSENRRLSVLDLSMNRIHKLDPSGFSGTPNLVKLDLSNNKLFGLGSLSSLSGLIFLNLSGNPLFSIDGIEEAAHLTVLDASHCELSSLPINFFKSGDLESVNLSRNAILELPTGMSSFTLIEFDLGNNKLSTLDESWLEHFPRLKRLSLNNNRLSEPFHSDILKRLEHVELLLHDNPWKCHCGDEKYREFHGILSTKSQHHSLICQSPSNVTGLTWKSACFEAEVEASVKKAKKNAWLPMLLAALTTLGIIILLYLLRRRSSGLRQSDRTVSNAQTESLTRTPPRIESQLPSYEEAILMPKPKTSGKANADTQTNASFLGSVRSLDSRRKSFHRSPSSNSL